MFEFGILEFKSMDQFKAFEATRELSPILLFQGEQFEFSEKHRRLKNLLIGNYCFLFYI